MRLISGRGTYSRNITTTVSMYSSRRYGEPRLKKPKELRGIKRAFSVDWFPKKCRCQCFVKDKDVWIKHRDFGSVALYGKERERFIKEHGVKLPQNFIFDDNWGAVVLRGEAWLLIKNLIVGRFF